MKPRHIAFTRTFESINLENDFPVDMWRNAGRILIGVLITLTGCTTSDNGTLPPDSFDAQSHVDAWVEFWNTYDLNQFDDLFLEDARLTYFSSEKEGLIHGYEAVREHHLGFEFVQGGRVPEQELWIENLQSSGYESVAIVAATWFFGDRNVESDSVSRGPMTAVYVWDGSAYKIAHMHFAAY